MARLLQSTASAARSTSPTLARAPGELAVEADVVGVRVRGQQAGQREAVPLDVLEHRRRLGAVGRDVRRGPPVVLFPLPPFTPGDAR